MKKIEKIIIKYPNRSIVLGNLFGFCCYFFILNPLDKFPNFYGVFLSALWILNAILFNLMMFIARVNFKQQFQLSQEALMELEFIGKSLAVNKKKRKELLGEIFFELKAFSFSKYQYTQLIIKIKDLFQLSLIRYKLIANERGQWAGSLTDLMYIPKHQSAK